MRPINQGNSVDLYLNYFLTEDCKSVVFQEGYHYWKSDKNCPTDNNFNESYTFYIKIYSSLSLYIF